jgi:hypothetical protein
VDEIFALLWLLWLALTVSAGVQTDTSLEVGTPSFTIVTNSTEKDGRRVARQA